MNGYNLFKIPFLFYICLMGCFVGKTHAYVLKGEHVIQLMITSNHSPIRLRVHQQVTFYHPDTQDPDKIYEDKTYEEAAVYRIPGEYRSDIDTTDFSRIHLASGDQSLTIVNNRITAEQEAWTDHYKDLFLYRSRKKMVDKLESLGINFSVTSLGRYNGIICYIVGAEYPDESVPQLWIDKETFQPVRWIFSASDTMGKSGHREILYENWKEYYKYWYPSEIKFYEGENLIRAITVGHVELNPSFSGDLFDIEHLRLLYSTSIFEDSESTRENDIEKRIEEFKQIYE